MIYLLLNVDYVNRSETKKVDLFLIADAIGNEMQSINLLKVSFK